MKKRVLYTVIAATLALALSGCWWPGHGGGHDHGHDDHGGDWHHDGH